MEHPISRTLDAPASRRVTMPLHLTSLSVLLFLTAVAPASAEQEGSRPWIVYDGYEGPGHGRHIVFVTGDEEYRSEESMPQLAKILARHHGFKCTVLFAIDRNDGTINPQQVDNIPGLEALADADLMVLFIRFRDLPDDQMKRILDYVNAAKPIVALRTSTHPFRFKEHQTYAKYDWQSKVEGFEGGFGRQVLGETWINHYGDHQKESTRGHVAEGMEKHPIVSGTKDIWGPSDVYGLTELTGDSQPIIMGQVLSGMNPDDPPNAEKKMVPVAWTKTYTPESGNKCKVFTTTMGHAGDLESEGFRRLLVNACYWALGLEEQIKPDSSVELVGPYDPTPIGFGKHTKGVRPSDHAIEEFRVTTRPANIKPRPPSTQPE